MFYMLPPSDEGVACKACSTLDALNNVGAGGGHVITFCVFV